MAPPPGAHAPPPSEATPQPAASPSFPWLPSHRTGRCSCKALALTSQRTGITVPGPGWVLSGLSYPQPADSVRPGDPKSTPPSPRGGGLASFAGGEGYRFHWGPLEMNGEEGLLAELVPVLSGSLANIPLTPETQRDQERRIRREIANSNERRRMQSINAGFQSLKTLIPHTDGEKLSKAAILQQTAEYIFSLEQEKTRLLQQNTQLKRFIQELSGSSPKRRRAEDKDEGIGSPDIWEDEKAEDLRREMIELRQQLDKERSVRMMLEEQVRSLEAHMYPEKLKVIAQQVQLQQQQEQVRLLHQEKLEREQQHLRTQLLPPPAPTHHPTVIVPAPPPPPSHHINVVTMGPSSVINSVSTSRQNLDTIVQAIQHIEGTQEKQELEEEQRRAVIVKPVRSCPEAPTSDTASDSEASDSDAMDQSREEPSGDGELP
ncbi:PREDICTED: transcription factor AP-4 [Rhinopithecus bieti]|uniref:transcription factor AP-4 n=1 Tax=Rhinopithecus bieti TaxID=61621 RepID=UPI00083C5D78|nr:PREDICTED: transcription factor AP-4 [Rhinopithecus bieti]